MCADVDLILLLLGLITLIRSQLPLSGPWGIRGRTARIIGLLLILPLSMDLLLSALSGLTGSASLAQTLTLVVAPALSLACLLGATLLTFNALFPNSGYTRLWMLSAVPALAIVLGDRLLFRPVFDYTVQNTALPLDQRSLLIDILIGIAIPLLLAFLAVLLFPIAGSFAKAALFALPAALTHLYHYSISGWFYQGLSSLFFPGDTPGAGFQEIRNGLLNLPLSVLVFCLVAGVCWLTSRLRLRPSQP